MDGILAHPWWHYVAAYAAFGAPVATWLVWEMSRQGDLSAVADTTEKLGGLWLMFLSVWPAYGAVVGLFEYGHYIKAPFRYMLFCIGWPLQYFFVNQKESR